MFLAGANSIFTGDKLLTTPNPKFSEDGLKLGSLSEDCFGVFHVATVYRLRGDFDATITGTLKRQGVSLR